MLPWVPRLDYWPVKTKICGGDVTMGTQIRLLASQNKNKLKRKIHKMYKKNFANPLKYFKIKF